MFVFHGSWTYGTVFSCELKIYREPSQGIMDGELDDGK